MKTYDHVIDSFYSTPWAITWAKLAEIERFVAAKARGEDIPAIDAGPRPGVTMAGKVALLPLFGVLSQRMNMLSQISGGTSTEQFGATLDQLVNDKTVRSILMVIDSPGGSVFGVEELGRKVAAAKEQKKIVAIADSLAASAAYWVASQASEFVVTPGGQVGSIGVIAAHRDLSKAEEMVGVKTTIIAAGKYKGEGDPSRPLGEEAQADMQSKVDAYYDLFVKAVARGRGTTEAAVRSGFGQGRVVTAKQAAELGMVDRVATLQQTLSRLGAGESADVPLGAKLASYQARAVEVGA